MVRKARVQRTPAQTGLPDQGLADAESVAPDAESPAAESERLAPASGVEAVEPDDANDPDAQLREVLAGPPPRGGGPAARPSRTATPAIILAVLLLIGSAAAAVTFAAFTGGLQLPTSAPSDVAVGQPTPTPAGSTPTSPSPSTLPTTQPTETVGPTLAPTPEPTPVSTPAPTSDRYALLTPCPSTPKCYLYTIRSGDNLSSIAHYFGVSLDAIRAMNPGLVTPIHAGEVIKLPPPTR